MSVDSGGAQGNSDSYFPAISADGRHVAFYSLATNLVPGDTNGFYDIFVHDRQTGATARVSVDSAGTQSNGASYDPALSADGRYVVFQSLASNLVAGDANGSRDVFVRNRQSGTTTRISLDSAGAEGNGNSFSPSISANGREIGFYSSASNLVAGDTNGVPDVFVRDALLAPTVYCTAGTTSNGCVPSIASSGTPQLNASSGFTLTVTSVEGQKTGLFFYGISRAIAVPWSATSTSYLCVKAPTQRTPVQSSGGTFFSCDGVLSIDFLAFMASNPTALGQPLYAGERFDIQAWFRDPPAPKTTNLSDALEFDVVP